MPIRFYRMGVMLALLVAFRSGARAAEPLPADGLGPKIHSRWPMLFDLYRDLHAHPELSQQEARTAGRLAELMRQDGFQVTERVGGYGLVCVLDNGPGKTVMIRTDLDALPIVERTGLEYASRVEVRDASGRPVGVMHACGHDVHMTCWVGAAATLAQQKDRWKGKLLFVGQPAEERGTGALAMLKDGLFERFGRPDFALALHCDSFAAAGTVGHTEGMALANVDSVDVTIRGKGGHGSAPHTTVDPIVVAARLVLDLQTIVSREVDPLDSAVVTVGSIHGGSKHNIIPPEVTLQLTVRTFKESTRQHVLEAIARMARAAAASARAPEPLVKVDHGEFTPAMYNDPALTRRVAATLEKALGKQRVYPKPPVMGGEDFSHFGRAGVPICMIRLGTVDPGRFQEFEKGRLSLPSLHSDLFAPIPEPTIKTGVHALCAAVLELLND